MMDILKRVFSIATLGIVILVALVDTASNQVAAQEDRNWIEVVSANFRIHSMLSEKKTLELSRQLEMFRTVALGITKTKSDTAPIPTEIYVLRGTKEMALFGFDNDSAGLFMPGLRDNLILMKDILGANETQIIQHEYVHFLMRNRSNFNYPRWYQEGFAEFLGASKIERGKFKVGVFPDMRKNALQYGDWISIKNILDPHDYADWSGRQRAMFYAQSWAMVHYLQTNPEHRVRFAQDMTSYIEYRKQGVSPIESFEKAFDVEVEAFGLVIKRYINTSITTYTFDPEQLLPDFSPQVMKMTREQAALGLAKIALRRGKLELAQKWYQIAGEDDDLQAYAEAGLGDVLKFQNEYDAALPHFEKAISLKADDPLVQLDMAEYWHTMASEDPEGGHLETARGYYQKAWNLDKNSPETYFMYGRTFLDEGIDIEKGIEMLEEAKHLIGAYPAIILSLLDAYVLVGRDDEAVAMARIVLGAAHTESSAAARAREVIEKIGGNYEPVSTEQEIIEAPADSN